jgi:predicted O-methyltransferase YrrM
MSIVDRVVRRLSGELLPELPFKSNHYLTTRVFSLDDDPFQPSQRIIDLTLEAVGAIREVSLDAVNGRSGVHRALQPERLLQWPGEHYKLLAALVHVLKPRRIIEIGTFEGWSSLSMKQSLPADGLITSFDIASWDTFGNTCLEQGDFTDRRLVQVVENLADPRIVSAHSSILQEAELVFMDGPHDGPTEYKMMQNLSSLHFANEPIFVFDDIKMHTMLKFWRDLKMPKLDITSFGHWSGTGIAEWRQNCI